MYFNPRALPLYFAHISLMYGSYMRRKPQKRTLEVAVFDGEVPYISEKPPVKKQNLPYITQMRLTEVLCGMWMIRTLVRVPFFENKPILFDLSLVAIALLTAAIPVSWPYLGQFGRNYMWFVAGVLFHRYEKWIREVCTGGMKIVLVCAAVIGCLITECGVESMLFGKIISLICVLAAYLVVPKHSTATLRKISRNSMGIYLFHSPLIYLSFNFWPNISPWLMVLINFVGFGAVAYGMTELVRKLGLGIVIGE